MKRSWIGQGTVRIRAFIRKAVESGDVARTKFEGARNVARQIISQALDKLCKQEGVISEEESFYENLLQSLQGRKDRSNNLQRLLVENISQTYDNLAADLKTDFRAGLEIGTLLLRSVPAIRDMDVQTWIKELGDRFSRQVSRQLTDQAAQIAAQVANEVRSWSDLVDAEIRNRKGVSAQGIAETALSDLSQRVANIVANPFPEDTAVKALPEDLQKITGMGFAGAVLIAVPLGAIVDVTGGIITASALALATGILVFKRRSIVSDFERKVDHSRNEVREQCRLRVAQKFDSVFHQITSALIEPLQRAQAENGKIQAMTLRGRDLLKRLDDLNW